MSAPTYTRQVNPWTNNLSAITATIMTNIENFLVNVSSWLANTISDANITSDGSGDLTVKKILLTTGSVKRIQTFSGSGTQSISHGWAEAPDAVIPYYAGSFGSPPSTAISLTGSNSSIFTVNAQSGYSWVAIAIKM